MIGYILVAVLVILGLGAYLIISRRKKPSVESKPAKKKICSIVLLLRKPREFSESEVRAAAASAFSKALNDGDLIVKQIKPELFGVGLKGLRFGVISSGKPYVEDISVAAQRVGDLRIRQVIQQHSAWMAVDWIGEVQKDFKDVMYRMIGLLLAELGESDGVEPVGVYATEVSRLAAFDKNTLNKLRSEDPLSAVAGDIPIINVKNDNPAMIAAVQEARRRWPEFVAAFEKRSAGQHFSAKGAFSEKGFTEFMWVSVSAIENGVAYGLLDNNPLNIKSLKAGSKVRVQVADLNDWIIAKNKSIVAGGFTIKVVAAAQKANES